MRMKKPPRAGVWRKLMALVCAAGMLQGWALPAHAGGTVVLYTLDGLENMYRDVLPAFERAQQVKVNIVTAGGGDVVNRANVEKNSPKADVLVTLPPFVQQAAGLGLLQPYQGANHAGVPAEAKARDGAWSTLMNNYFSFAVNPNITPHAPRTFADLLGPEYAGRLAYSNPLTAGDGMAVIILTTQLMGEDPAFDYLQKLERNVKFHTRGTGYLDVLLSRNEIAVANGDVQMDLDDAANGGLSIKPVFLSVAAHEPPATLSLPYTIALVKGGPNAANGKKLIDYLLSRDVQARMGDYFGIPGRADVPLTGKNSAAIRSAIAGVRVVPVDWDQVLAKKPAWTARWKSQVIGHSDKPLEVVKPK